MSYRYSHDSLVSWSIKKCMICGKFIGKFRRKYYKGCLDKISKVLIKKDKVERAHPITRYTLKTLVELSESPLPNYLALSLREI